MRDYTPTQKLGITLFALLLVGVLLWLACQPEAVMA